MNEKMQNAIKRVYTAFKTKRPQHIEGCPCCSHTVDIGKLLSKSLTYLTAEDLSRYACKALTTVGNEEDYQYFLPRILEIHIQEPSWWPELFMTLDRIYMSGFINWDKEKQDAIIAYLDARLQLPMASDLVDEWIPPIQEFVTKINKSGAPVAQRLNAWFTSESMMRTIAAMYQAD